MAPPRQTLGSNCRVVDLQRGVILRWTAEPPAQSDLTRAGISQALVPAGRH